MDSKEQMDGETLGGEHGGVRVGRSQIPQNSKHQENVLVMANKGSHYYVPRTVPSSLYKIVNLTTL